MLLDKILEQAPNLRSASPGPWYSAPFLLAAFASDGILLFPEKEAKALFCFAEARFYTQISAKPTQGVWGRAPNSMEMVIFFFF
jgi:hypothetical protein